MADMDPSWKAGDYKAYGHELIIRWCTLTRRPVDQCYQLLALRLNVPEPEAHFSGKTCLVTLRHMCAELERITAEAKPRKPAQYTPKKHAPVMLGQHELARVYRTQRWNQKKALYLSLVSQLLTSRITSSGVARAR